jgi:hypothetical protein
VTEPGLQAGSPLTAPAGLRRRAAESRAGHFPGTFVTASARPPFVNRALTVFVLSGCGLVQVWAAVQLDDGAPVDRVDAVPG